MVGPCGGGPDTKNKVGLGGATNRSRPLEGDEMRAYWFAAEE